MLICITIINIANKRQRALECMISELWSVYRSSTVYIRDLQCISEFYSVYQSSEVYQSSTVYIRALYTVYIRVLQCISESSAVYIRALKCISELYSVYKSSISVYVRALYQCISTLYISVYRLFCLIFSPMQTCQIILHIL